MPIMQTMPIMRPDNAKCAHNAICASQTMPNMQTMPIVHTMPFLTATQCQLSSPRAKRAGPKGLRAESARAVTGRQCPHSGVGEDFLARWPVFFMKRAVSRKPKVKKLIRRCQIDCLAEVYKWVIGKIQGPIAKTGFWGQNPNFWAQKKGLTS